MIWRYLPVVRKIPTILSMAGLRALLVLLTVSALILVDGESSGSSLVITTLQDGTSVHGITDNSGIDMFLGIRYGVIPKRFARSRPAWGNGPHVIDATKPGANCWQDDTEFFTNETLSEDCLFINVWGDVHADKKKPVMVWIHGGGFMTGSGTPVGADGVGLFNGASLALHEDIVVVTLNYRLGSFGFLVLDDKKQTGGMNGIRDQILALHWVQDNIAHFGGDRNEVTIFGESAGGESVCMLSIAPDAATLFKRAIIQSGPCVGPWGPDSTAVGQKQRSLIFNALNVSSIDALRAVSPRALTKVGWPVAGGEWFYDRDFLPHNTSWYFSSGNVHVEDLIIGGNSYDGLVYFLHPDIPKTNAEFKQYLNMTYGSATASKVYEAYDPDNSFNGNVFAAFVQQDGDNNVMCPTLSIAQMLTASASKTRVWSYYYAHRFDCVDFAGILGLLHRYIRPPNDFPDWASHAAELSLLFGNLQFKDYLAKRWDQCAPKMNVAHLAVSRTMQKLWGDVARGFPKSSLWRQFSDNSLVVIAPTAGYVRADFKKKQCAALPSSQPDHYV